MNDFRNLQVYQKSLDLVELIHKITKEFPIDEKYGLTSQIRRAAVSIPSNIAEGAGRFSKKDFGHFLAIAIGSCYELETQIVLAYRFEYINRYTYDSKVVNEKIIEVQKMIGGLKKSLL